MVSVPQHKAAVIMMLTRMTSVRKASTEGKEEHSNKISLTLTQTLASIDDLSTEGEREGKGRAHIGMINLLNPN